VVIWGGDSCLGVELTATLNMNGPVGPIATRPIYRYKDRSSVKVAQVKSKAN